jgi:HSP20 family molecular chaperone IbpA
MSNLMYLDQIFDEIFSNFFNDQCRTKRLLTEASENKSIQERFPTYPVSNYYLEPDGTNVMEFAVLGFQREDLDVSIVDNILTISGEKCEEEEKAEKEGRLYVHRRLAKRNFKNSYKLASRVDIDQLDISLKDGMLKIRIPLKEEEKRKPKQLEIK